MPEHLSKVHPLVPTSPLRAGRADAIDAFDNSVDSAMDVDEDGEGSDGDYSGQEESSSSVAMYGEKEVRKFQCRSGP